MRALWSVDMLTPHSKPIYYKIHPVSHSSHEEGKEKYPKKNILPSTASETVHSAFDDRSQTIPDHHTRISLADLSNGLISRLNHLFGHSIRLRMLVRRRKLLFLVLTRSRNLPFWLLSYQIHPRMRLNAGEPSVNRNWRAIIYELDKNVLWGCVIKIIISSILIKLKIRQYG